MRRQLRSIGVRLEVSDQVNVCAVARKYKVSLAIVLRACAKMIPTTDEKTLRKLIVDSYMARGGDTSRKVK
jgi:hypothetical protein